MTLNPAARATARRNVSERIDRFLNGLEGVRRLPNRRELFWLRTALANLEDDLANELPLISKDLGEVALKNLARPVRVCQVTLT